MAKALAKFDPVRKERFVHYLILGHHPYKAAQLSGFSGRLKSVSDQLMADEYVRDLLLAYRDEMQKRLRVDRDRVTEMTMDAYDMAKIQADPRNMLGAIQELNKMYGLYAPDEVRVTKVNEKAGEIKRNLQTLSEEELLRLASEAEGAEILDAEFVELEPLKEREEYANDDE